MMVILKVASMAKCPKLTASSHTANRISCASYVTEAAYRGRDLVPVTPFGLSRSAPWDGLLHICEIFDNTSTRIMGTSC
jgi:hypothetical protein